MNRATRAHHSPHMSSLLPDPCSCPRGSCSSSLSYSELRGFPVRACTTFPTECMTRSETHCLLRSRAPSWPLWSSTGQATPTPALPRSRPCSIKENVLVLRYLIQGNSRGMLLIYPPQTVPKALLNTTVREGVAGVFPEDLAWKGGDAHMIFGLLDANSAHRVGFQTRADHFCFRDRS